MLSNDSLHHAKVPVAFANTLGITMQVEMSPGWVLLELLVMCVCVCVCALIKSDVRFLF